jgi:hypothetical protein
MKKPTMTDKNVAAHRSNGRKSRGSVSPEGKERARAANLRHGMYSKLRDEALTSLGEDPALLATLIDGAYEQWRPANDSQAQIVEHLARLQWRMDRAERMQDNLAAQHVEKAAAERHKNTMDLRYRYMAQVGFLRLVRSQALRRDFYAPPSFLHQFGKDFGEMAGHAPVIFELLHRLGKPPALPEVQSPLPAEATTDADWEMALALAEEDPDSSLPRPDLPVAEEAEERDELREDLRLLTQQELEAVEAVWDPIFDRYMKPMTTAERDQSAAQIDCTLERLRRHEESCLRQFWRLGNILMKLQDREGREESEVPSPKSEKQESEVRSQESGAEVGMQDFGFRIPDLRSHAGKSPAGGTAQDSGSVGQDSGSRIRDLGSDSGSRIQDLGQEAGRPESGVRSQEPEVGAAGQDSGSRIQDLDSKAGKRVVGEATQDSGTEVTEAPAHTRKNAGASGDVDENTGGSLAGKALHCSVPLTGARAHSALSGDVQRKGASALGSEPPAGASEASQAAAA